MLGGKCAAALPVSAREARIDSESAILLGDSAIEVPALIIDCTAAAIARGVLRIGGYRRIASSRALSSARWRLYCSAREACRRASSVTLHWWVAIAFAQAASRFSRSAFASLHTSRSSAAEVLTKAASRTGNAVGCGSSFTSSQRTLDTDSAGSYLRRSARASFRRTSEHGEMILRGRLDPFNIRRRVVESVADRMFCSVLATTEWPPSAGSDCLQRPCQARTNCCCELSALRQLESSAPRRRSDS
jgi:hypothetical protein